MKTVLICGGTGLIGSYLSEMLFEGGYTIRHLSRKANMKAKFPAYAWNIQQNKIDLKAFEGVDVVIQLAGAGIADKRWTKQRKKEIIESRVEATRLLYRSIETLDKKPSICIHSSAVGYYGDRGSEELTESSSVGIGFMAEVCKEWEEASTKFEALVPRNIIVRTGVVLSTKGGALEKILMTFPFRIASYFGTGQQYMPWIHIKDQCKMIKFFIENESSKGIYNGVAPDPVSNKILTKAFVSAYPKKVVLMPAPKIALRAILGDMAAVIFNSNRVLPEKILKHGFRFEFADIKSAAEDLIQNKNDD